jgi:hypothetical protein
MNFGPLIPQEIDSVVEFLEKNKIPFEIHFNEEGARKELEPSPGNNVLYSDLRTKTYLAQHFYIEVSDEFLINNPKVENQILKHITKDDFTDAPRIEEENVIHIHEQKIMENRSKRAKWVQKAFAIIFLASMLYGIISSLKNK